MTEVYVFGANRCKIESKRMKQTKVVCIPIAMSKNVASNWSHIMYCAWTRCARQHGRKKGAQAKVWLQCKRRTVDTRSNGIVTFDANKQPETAKTSRKWQRKMMQDKQNLPNLHGSRRDEATKRRKNTEANLKWKNVIKRQRNGEQVRNKILWRRIKWNNKTNTVSNEERERERKKRSKTLWIELGWNEFCMCNSRIKRRCRCMPRER